MKNDLSVIITLFKTPAEQLKSLSQYKNYPLLIFEQDTKNNSEKFKFDLIMNIGKKLKKKIMLYLKFIYSSS